MLICCIIRLDDWGGTIFSSPGTLLENTASFGVLAGIQELGWERLMMERLQRLSDARVVVFWSLIGRTESPDAVGARVARAPIRGLTHDLVSSPLAMYYSLAFLSVYHGDSSEGII